MNRKTMGVSLSVIGTAGIAFGLMLFFLIAIINEPLFLIPSLCFMFFGTVGFIVGYADLVSQDAINVKGEQDG